MFNLDSMPHIKELILLAEYLIEVRQSSHSHAIAELDAHTASAYYYWESPASAPGKLLWQ